MFKIETASRRATFTEIGRTGRSGVWWVLGGLLFTVTGYVVLTTAMVAFLAHVWPGRLVAGQQISWYSVELPQALLNYAAPMAGLGLLALMSWLTTRHIHKRPGLSLLTARPRFDLSALLRSMAVMVALQLLGVLVLAILVPDRLTTVLNPTAYLPFLLLSVILLPLQVLGEEVFFRGYLMQLVGRFIRNRVIILLIPALVFASMHFLNPHEAYNDMWTKGIYVFMALYLGFLVLKTGGLEHSIGIHLGNNILAIHVFGSDLEPPLAPSIFTYAPPSTMVEFFLQLAIFLLHYLLFFGPFGKWLNR